MCSVQQQTLVHSQGSALGTTAGYQAGKYRYAATADAEQASFGGVGRIARAAEAD